MTILYLLNNYKNILNPTLNQIILKSPEIVSFTSGEAFIYLIKVKKILSFLDIEMPGMNGIYVGNELKQSNKNVIVFVVTSYSEYLDEAMRFHVFRYSIQTFG